MKWSITYKQHQLRLKNNNNGRWSRWISHSPEVKRNICLFWSSVQRWGYKPSVECPFKLFTAQSGVFFSSDLKMGIGGHPFFPAGSPSPLFLLVPTPSSSSSSSLCLLLKCCSGRTLGNKKWWKVQPRTPLDLYVMHRHAHICDEGWRLAVETMLCPSGLTLQWNNICSK